MLASPEMVRRSGYWCSQGDTLVSDLRAILGTAHWLPVEEVVKARGVVLGIQGLVGAKDPKLAERAALHYADTLAMCAIELWNEQTGAKESSPSALLAKSDAQRKRAARYWWEQSKAQAQPGVSMLARTLFMLLAGDWPLAIRATHASITFLDARKLGEAVPDLEHLFLESIHACTNA